MSKTKRRIKKDNYNLKYFLPVQMTKKQSRFLVDLKLIIENENYLKNIEESKSKNALNFVGIKRNLTIDRCPNFLNNLSEEKQISLKNTKKELISEIYGDKYQEFSQNNFERLALFGFLNLIWIIIKKIFNLFTSIFKLSIKFSLFLGNFFLKIIKYFEKTIKLFYHWLSVFGKILFTMPVYTNKLFINTVPVISHFSILKSSNFKKIFVFCIISFFITIPLVIIFYFRILNQESLKGRVLGISEAVINNFISASEAIKNGDFEKANKNFEMAEKNFYQLEKNLNEVNSFLFKLAALSPDDKIKIATDLDKIVTAGKAAAEMGSNLSIIFQKENKEFFKIEQFLNNFKVYGSKALVNAGILEKNLKEIDIDKIPEQYRDQFTFIINKINVVIKGLRESLEMTDEIEEFLGMTEDKRYLFVFQNNAEIRATGGFIGSFATIDFRNGKIKNIFSPGGGSYDTAEGLRQNIVSPEPLWLINPKWNFWDANWWPDWPTSARKLIWFYEKSDGPTVDGCIALTPSIIEKMLEIFGPIDMTNDYGVVINSENFWQTIQRFSEEKPYKTKTPKKIIGDLMEKMFNDIPTKIDSFKFIALIKILKQALNEKQILFYFTDQSLQQKVSNLGWSGEMKKTKGDFLAVINTNIGGGKSDRKIKEAINHRAEILEDGSIVDSIVIERSHVAERREEFIGVKNINWMRVYVPKGSRLLEAYGFWIPDKKLFEYPEESWIKDADLKKEESFSFVHESSGTKIYDEGDYTVFANWTMTEPNRTSKIYLRYSLPFRLESQKKDGKFNNFLQWIGFKNNKEIYSYSLLFQKQAGSQPSEILSDLKINGKIKILKYFSDSVKDDGWFINDQLDSDKYWGIIFEK